MRDYLAALLRRLADKVDPVALPPSQFDITPDLLIGESEAGLFRTVGRKAQALARHFGDRQNSKSELTPREATDVVTALLNCGNLMCGLADRQQPAAPEAPEAPKEQP